MIAYNQKGEAYIVEKRRVKGTFLENLELNDFPFDVQVKVKHPCTYTQLISICAPSGVTMQLNR